MAVNASAVWRVRPSGSNTNGGGYDAGISGAATDYSQQNAAQATGVHGTATGTTTFIDATAANFTSAMVGNAIWIASGAGFTVGAYFVTGFTSASQVTLDRSPGTGTVAVWALGGGWAGWTNCATTGPVVAGNTVYFLGSGTPSPSSYVPDYTVSSNVTLAAGSSTAGAITFTNDPLTPNYKAPPNTTGGMPVIKSNANPTLTSGAYNKFSGLWFIGSSGVGNGGVLFSNLAAFAAGPPVYFGCVFDQAGFSSYMLNLSGNMIGCEIFSSVAGSNDGNGALNFANNAVYMLGCNIHDTVSVGMYVGGTGVITVSGCIIAKCANIGIQHGSASGIPSLYINNTFDGNGSIGLNLANQIDAVVIVMNNIFSNHASGGAFQVSAGTATQNTALASLFDYNVFYNNVANYIGINAGPHDTILGVNPYVSSATENYQLS